MISATGQGDMEVARVSMLHVAATGYAPLIYDLTQNAGFELFYQKCQQVWKNLEADPALPKKLVCMFYVFDELVQFIEYSLL